MQAITRLNSSGPNGSGSQSFSDLLHLARHGDREARGRLLQWYGNYLNLLATTRLDRRLRRRLNPSDVVQEAMLAAHRDFDGFRGESQGELLCWLRTILIHTLHRSFEKHITVEKRDVRREVSLDQPIAMENSASRLASIVPAREGAGRTADDDPHAGFELADRLGCLKPAYREVILLRIVQGLSFEQIGTRMGRSNGAVRMLWLRALDAFKSQNLSVTNGAHRDGCHQSN